MKAPIWEGWFDSGDHADRYTRRTFSAQTAAEDIAREYGEPHDCETIRVRVKRVDDLDSRAVMYDVTFRIECTSKEVTT